MLSAVLITFARSDISFFSHLEFARGYSILYSLKSTMVWGITVSCVLIPQLIHIVLSLDLGSKVSGESISKPATRHNVCLDR